MITRHMVILLAVVFAAAISVAAEPVSTADSAASVRKRDNLRKKLGNDDDLRSLCSGLKICMNVDYEGCSEEDKKPWAKVRYNDEFCAPYKEIAARGYAPDPKSQMVPEIYARLGRQYRVIYEYKGTLPLNEHVISYLFDNMPFTAQLINAYLDESYTLEYAHPNRRFFNGSNGRSLSGEFYWALQDSAGQRLGMRNLFFGYGHAKVLRWSLHGTAVAYLDMDQLPNGHIKYKLTAIVFPGNSMLNSIMQMKVFRSVVNSKIEHIVDDIKRAAGMYFGGNKEPMLKSAALKSTENIQYVLDFESVVNGAPWKLGDFEKLQRARLEQRKKDLNAVPIKVNDTQPIKEQK
ncbi:hypothetical protein [uncultured Fibrobacter sp.]|uniref:hypothetical protein n=1 Tax=uncultured Fibrobacter sp. TaxID=261512 RepID=UPI00261232C7|nr:hypothetical protein [uncultured Fibrobacter sp.]